MLLPEAEGKDAIEGRLGRLEPETEAIDGGLDSEGSEAPDEVSAGGRLLLLLGLELLEARAIGEYCQVLVETGSMGAWMTCGVEVEVEEEEAEAPAVEAEEDCVVRPLRMTYWRAGWPGLRVTCMLNEPGESAAQRQQ